MLLMLVLSVQHVSAATCVYLSSYHKGYEWNDGIERGMDKILQGKCEVKKFYMDTKRNTDSLFGKKQAVNAKEFIISSKADVIIAADDNASRLVIKPFFKDKKIPIVFCGINWTVDEYEYPYSNATGMIEVAPILKTLKIIRQVMTTPLQGIYLSSDVFTEYKDFDRYREVFSELGVELTAAFVKNKREWKKAYTAGQKANFIVIANNAGINDWDKEEIIKYVRNDSKVFTVTNYEWMMPYTIFGLIKQPEEQGEWAAQVAVAVLNGQLISNIPIVINRKTNLFVNSNLLKRTAIKLPEHIWHKAIKVGQ